MIAEAEVEPLVSSEPWHDGESEVGGCGTIKLLDLLTNRYHVGRICARIGSALELELSSGTHWQAGQQVRFVEAGDQPLVSKVTMRGACVIHVERARAGARVALRVLPEPAAA